MNKVKVLIEGYAKETDNGWVASSTTTLITTDKHKVIVDPGINRKLLLEKLKEENLSVKELDYVFVTHYHPDHMLLAGIFENATVFDGDTIYKNDEEVEYKDNLPDTNIKVLLTPGHAHEHASLIVDTEDLGTVVIAADVFWWMGNEEQNTNPDIILKKDDPFTKNVDELRKSREEILEIADWVIPGHGKMFKVERDENGQK
jgi:glyoxylase-like metal-dependent hydrolase (beta-lactamase superfamily II)